MRSIVVTVFALFAVACFQGCSSEDDGDKKSLVATGGVTGTGGLPGTGSTGTGGIVSTGGVPTGAGSTVSTGGTTAQPTCPASPSYCPATGSGVACCLGSTCGTDLGMGCVAVVPDAGP